MHIKYFWTIFNFIYYIYNFFKYKNLNFFKKLGSLTINLRGGQDLDPERSQRLSPSSAGPARAGCKKP